MTHEEARELNSNCAFCKREKFVEQENPEDGTYSLVRCADPACADHCEFGHTQKVDIPDGREDVVEIASGWGSH